jgi:Sec-independent protein translocase protein TatA
VGIALAILYWLLFAIVILAIVLVAAILFGGMNSPELKQQIEDAIRAAQAAKP